MERLRRLIHAPCFLAFLISAHVCTGQISDNFSDGNFNSNPTWSGSAPEFIVNGLLQLQLNSTVASTSNLSVPFAAASLNNFEWQVFVKQSFAPSGSNYGRVYLVSDQSNLSGPLNGYYLQFGEALSGDAVELFRQTGLTSVSVCRATNAAIASTVNLSIRVLRSNSGRWQLFIDYAGGTNFVLEATGTDATHNTSAFMGVLCVYTASNASKFFYDDFYMGPEVVDTTPPIIQSLNPVSATQLDVVFSEKLDPVSSQLTSNYEVNNSVGNPTTAALQADEKTVQLTFLQSFPNGITSQLTVSGVEDLFNNAVGTIHENFLFFQPVAAQRKDIIITEIFPDPTPSIGLPEAEFIEIYNRSSTIFDLQNWKITDGSSVGVLPSHLVFPGDYIILTSATSASQFNSFGTVLSVPNFPTLNNAGDALTLKDNLDVFIDNVTYTDSWYNDEDKMQGGYTLELIDPANPCSEKENWGASDFRNGGTPGAQNSVFASKPDLTGPKLISVVPTSATELIIRFNEKLEGELPTSSTFSISPSISVSQMSFADESLKMITVLLGTELLPATSYSITAQNFYDCNGNILQEQFNTITFGLPEQPASSDLVINEILFNPLPTGVDFVEVYNSSIKFFNLKNWMISNYENGLILNAKVITEEDFLLAPNQYIVFTEDGEILKGEYIASNEKNFFEMADLPSFSDDIGSVALLDPDNNIIDAFSYTDKLHSIFIDDEEGVSLERISFTASTNNNANWKSASSLVGFATPGYANSNVSGLQAAGKITIMPEVFEPVTGQPSFAQIQYNFEHGGNVANVKILDTHGREIKELVNNATLGTEGFFRWDGETNDGTKARIGYYVVWVEVFNDRGDVETFRKRVVVASKF